jgi:copper transport protein
VHQAASGAAAAPAAASGGTGRIEAALRALDLAALALALGPLAVLLVCLPRARTAATAAPQLRALAALGAAAALLTGAALVAQRAADAGAGRPVSVLQRVVAGTPFGQRYALRELLLVALLLLLAGSWRRMTLPLAALGCGIALAEAAAGHAAALRHGAPLAVASMGAHVLAAAVWSGGVAALALVSGREARRDRAAAGALLRAFGPLAATAAVTLLVTGLYAAGREVPTPDALLRSAYGHVLLVKLAVAAAVAGLGAWHALRLHRRGRSQLPHRSTLALEALLALAVLGLGGVLAASPPPPAPVRVASGPAPSVQADGRAGDLIVDLAVSPNRPGPNFVTATVLDSRIPRPAPVTAVRLRLTPPVGPPVELVARAVGGRPNQAAPERSRAGRVRIDLLVTRPGLETPVFSTPWIVGRGGPAAPPASVLLSDRPLGPLAVRLAAVLALLAACGGAVAASRRGRPKRPLAGATR